jgi:radical SAM protein with 4Fe4S-binding SPASM domain
VDACAVHANLDVSTCHPVKEPVYGRWRPGLLRELGAFPAHRRFAERDCEGCSSCEHKEACGHCRAFVTSSNHDLFGNDRICYEVLERPQSSGAAGGAKALRPTADGRSRVHLPIVRSVV